LLKLQLNNKETAVWDEIDISSKQFIRAIINRDKDTLKQYVAKNINVSDDGLQIIMKKLNNMNVYHLPSIINEFKYRYRHVNADIFTIGYECTDSKDTWIMVLDFVNEDGTWKIQNIQNDI
jgi:hypothetical protein